MVSRFRQGLTSNTNGELIQFIFFEVQWTDDGTPTVTLAASELLAGWASNALSSGAAGQESLIGGVRLVNLPGSKGQRLAKG